MINLETIKIALNKDPFHYTNDISIETTNRCNYASIHVKCPLHYMKEKMIMPLSLVEKLLKELGENDYRGIIYPFNYGEPLMDPRMFTILEMIKKYVSKAEIRIFTNGFMVDDTMLSELSDAGVKRLIFSMYTPQEETYIKALINRMKNEISIKLTTARRWPVANNMYNVVDMDKWEKINLNKVCYAPYNSLYVNVKGEVAICCHDWQGLHTFGNIKDKSLVDIIKSDLTMEAYNNLRNKNRAVYKLCSRCIYHR